MDPQEYTDRDRHAEHVATELPCLAEVTSAALAFIRAIQKFDRSTLVTGIEPVEELSHWLAENITESVNLYEDDRYPHYTRSDFSERVDDERKSWLRTLDQERVDALQAAHTLNLGKMVVDILGVKS
jgi:hypothetical protein